jgi:hypothetical protein
VQTFPFLGVHSVRHTQNDIGKIKIPQLKNGIILIPKKAG